MTAHKLPAVSLLLLVLSAGPQIAQGASPASLTATAGTPQSTLVGTQFAAALEVTARDSGGNPVSGVSVIFAAPVSGSSAGLSSGSAVTNASGVASVTATANSTAGPYSVTAISGKLSATFSLTNTSATPGSITATGGTPQSTVVGTPFSLPLQVTVKDSGGTPISGATVTFAVPSSGAGANLSGSTAVTDASGVASVSAVANANPGSYTVTASVNSLTASFSLTNAAGEATSITATNGTPQSATVGTMFGIVLQVTVRGANGFPVSGVSVSFAAPTSGASATLSAGSAITDAFGVASVGATANSTPGSYTVTATAGSLSATFLLTNAALTPGSITATGGTAQSTLVSTAFASPLQVTVKDSGGTPVSGVVVTFAAPTSGASATLSSTSATTNSSGVASVTATANSTAGSYSVTAIVGSLSAVFSLSNVTATPASIATNGGTPQTTATGSPFQNSLQVIVKDSGGSSISGVTVTFAAPASGPSAALSSTTAVTNASGLAGVSAIANSVPGSYSVTASVGSLSTTFSLNNATGQPASITATGGTPQSTTAGTAFSSALSATVKDAGGNPLPGITVTFAVPASAASATLSSTTAITNASGVASVTATANGIPGSYSVTATAGSFTAIFLLSNTAASPASITATGGTPQSAAVGTAFSNALQAIVKDAGGNPLSGITVTFAAPASGASATLSNTTAVTNASGVASVTATANTIPGSYLVTAAAGAFSTTFSLTNTGSTAATVIATLGVSQSATMGAPFADALRVMVRDVNGIPVSGVTVTFAAPATGASAFLSSTTAVTNALGNASVTATANFVPGNYTVTATVGTATATFSLSNVVGRPASITSSRGTPQSTAVGTAFAIPLQVTVRDSNSNLVPGATIFFIAPTVGAGATLSNTTVTTNAQGIASVIATANTTAGSYVVSATVDTFNTLFSLTNTGAGAPSNLALGKTASQSSTLAGVASAAAASAVDGTTNGSFYAGSVTATNQESSPWWQVDLGGPATVGSVVIFNRTDCCGTRLGDYWVFVSNTPFQASDTPATLQNRAGTFASHQTAPPSPSTIIDAGGAQGRYVRIQLTGIDYLSLAEVQVMGTGGGTASSNLAAGKTANQSSTLPGYPSAGASSAADGSTDGSFYNGSVTATNQESSPWWQVDLGASAAIDSVTVWNRTDCCGSRLGDYWVFISETPFLATDTPAILQNRAGTFASHQTSAPSPSTSISMAGAQGRYVRIQLSGIDYLSLAEVQVFGTGGSTAGTSNVAQGKTAAQSSTLAGYPGTGAASAVDGSTDGSFYNGSVSTTDIENSPWWQVDLGASKSVNSVVVWNRTDCCGSRLGDYWVFVSDTPFTASDTPATLQSRANTFASHQTAAPAPSSSIAVGAPGRYVRVQLSGQNYLSLAEVQVMGQ